MYNRNYGGLDYARVYSVIAKVRAKPKVFANLPVTDGYTRPLPASMTKGTRMKILITILGILNGGYMLLDGVYVLLNGKYIGSERPGPWSLLFEKWNVDVFKLAPLFITFGILWLIWIYGLWTNQQWAFTLGIVISILTLWYLPIGTLISLIVFGILIFARQKLGI